MRQATSLFDQSDAIGGSPGSAGEVARLVSQRVDAAGLVAVHRSAGRTRLARLRQEGAAKIKFPASAHDPLEAVLINTAGGLTGGDRIAWSAVIRPDSALTVTTQACERIYRAGHGHSAMTIALKAAAGTRLAWLPQETILFDGAALKRRLDVDLEVGAHGLFVEAVIFGREAMGETVQTGLLRDDWRVRVGGRLVHAEAISIGPEVVATLRRRASASGARAIATVLSIGEDCERHLDAARAIVGDRGGVSAWTVGAHDAPRHGKLLARLIAADGYSLRKRLVPLLKLLNGDAGLPKVWSL